MYRLDDNVTSTNTPEEAAVLEEVKEILSAGGNSEVTIVPQIQWAKFAKNMNNVAFSSVSTLSGSVKPSIPLELTGALIELSVTP